VISALLTVIVYLLVLGILWYLVEFIITALPIPDPPARMIRIAVVVLFCLIVIVLLLSLVGVSTGIDLPRIQP
jgi:hypothetical protein